ncbi:adenylate kinase 7 isoform X8 [Syngnathoides biaculeatus]|uniref:adenylate kinase 7 isoform X8 n=1 Tax=Syngnathoides biaculeatus TaxID=300417 RepID=UPI002ADDAD5A|nr:adenylate kinase 7 isoform X8 [Syngnathoides biaculeatus]
MDKDRQLQERVFINDIDSFSSKCIAKCLAKHSLECDGSAEKECRTLKLNDSGSRSYRVVGTISDGSEDDRPYVLEAYIRPSREKILQKLMECDVIVYNITQHPEQVDEARWAVTALHDKINDFGQPKKFILISTVMTWACSEPINSDDLELPFTDDDFRRRKAHPNFEKHLELEKMVTKVGKMTITSALGFGKIQRKTFEEAFLQQDLSIMDIDLLHVNLCMEGVHLKELFTIHWLCEFGLVENIELVVEEYRQIRGLLPIRACVLGPPAVGKSTVSRQICDYYKLHHVRLNETISETISHLEYMMRHTFSDPENDDSATATEAQELLSIINDNMEQNGVISLPLGYLDDQMLVKVMMDKLISNPCKNQGFVLDGFPKTYEQAKELFHVDEHESDERTPISLSNKKIMPEFVFILDASDSLLKDRVMNLPEKLVQEHKYEQEHFLQILAKYREKNMEEESVVNYLEELDINPLLIEITSISIPDNQLLMHTICERVGKPRNYAQNNEKIQKEGMMLIETTVKAEREQKELEEARQRSAHWEMWTKTLEEKRQWEVQQLEVLSVQMKTYLTEHIITTLSLGLIACGSAWPEDPIDFMAEYLIKNNP